MKEISYKKRNPLDTPTGFFSVTTSINSLSFALFHFTPITHMYLTASTIQTDGARGALVI
jgi:hypothetical protein